MKFPVFILITLLLIIPYKTCEGEPSTGPDGVIIWDPLPSLGSFVVQPEQYKTDRNRPATLASMSSGWLDFIQPAGFPLDYVVHLIELLANDFDANNVDVWDEVKLGLTSFLGIIVCFSLGIIFFLVVPLIAIFFFLCRCCGNCGGKLEQEYSNLCCKQVFYTTALAMSIAVLCAGAVYLDKSNTFMTTSKNESIQSSLSIVEDVKTFTDGSVVQLSQILEEEYTFVEDLTLFDLQNIGNLVAAPVQNYLLEEVKLDELFIDFEKLISDVETTSITLLGMQASRTNLIDAADDLSTGLQDISDDIDAINLSCGGCVPSNNGLIVRIDYTLLPLLDAQTSGADDAKNDITAMYDQGVQAIDGIASDINTAAQAPVNDIEGVIQSTSDNVAKIYNDIEKSLSSLSDELGNVKTSIEDWVDQADQFDFYRDYLMLALALCGFLIFTIYFVAMVMGSLFSHGEEDPTRRNSGSDCCGIFLMFGVLLTFILTPLLMFFTSMFFVTVTPISLTCKPLSNLNMFKETIDQPDLISPGYWLGDLVLGNSSIPLNISSILEECEKNHTIYNALQLVHVLNVDELKQIITELRKNTDKLVDEIDIGDIDLSDLVPDNLDVILNAAVAQIQLELIDFITLETLLQENVTTDDLLAYAIELETAADNEPEPDKTAMKQVAIDLRQLQHSNVQPMEDEMASMLSDTNLIKDHYITQLYGDVNNTVKSGAVAETGLSDTQSIEDELDASVIVYIDGVIGYLDQFIDVAARQLSDEFAICYPLRAVYDAAINLTCYYVLDSLNTVWFSLGWCVFWMIVSLIFAVKLSKYYRTMRTMKIPKNHVANVDYQDMPMTSYTDTETGRSNPDGDTLHLNDINSRYEGPPNTDVPPFLPPPSYEESQYGYGKEIQC